MKFECTRLVDRVTLSGKFFPENVKKLSATILGKCRKIEAQAKKFRPGLDSAF